MQWYRSPTSSAKRSPQRRACSTRRGAGPRRRPKARLGDADAWDRDLLEKMRSRDGRGRIGGEFRHELGMTERRPKSGGRLPNGVVEIGRALAYRAMQLGRDEARLPFHELRVVSPNLKERRFVRLIEGEDVHQHDGGSVDRNLTLDREGRVQWAQRRHETLHILLASRPQFLVQMRYHIDII